MKVTVLTIHSKDYFVLAVDFVNVKNSIQPTCVNNKYLYYCFF